MLTTCKAPSRRWYAALAIAMVTVIVALTPGVALAAPVPTGLDEREYRPPGFSYGEASWDQVHDRIDSLEAHPGAAFAANYCLAGIFDWATADSGHFDARAVKTCRSSVHIDIISPDAQLGRWLTGMQRWGACYGPVNGTNTTASNCANDSRADLSVVRTGSGTEDASGPNVNFGGGTINWCARGWYVAPNTTSVLHYPGGNSDACAS